MKTYDYRHRVGFEETNLVGNVYYVNLLRWQGRCRELFLLEHAPEVLAEFDRGLCLVTVHCSCDYLNELRAFDEVLVRMRLENMTRSQVGMRFEYWRVSMEEELVARGEQRVACMRRGTAGPEPTAFPPGLRAALEGYSESRSRSHFEERT